RVVDHRQIGPETGNADTNAGSIIFTSARERPAPGRLTVAGQGKLQQGSVLGHEVAHPSAPFFCELSRVRCGNDRGPWLLCPTPRGKQNRAVGALRRSGWHEHGEAVDFPPCDLFQLADQQEVMRRWLKAAVPRPVS